MSFGVVRVGHRQLLEGLGLGGAQEGEELRHVERVGAVVVLRAAGDVAGAAVGRGRFGGRVRRDGQAIHAGHVPHDQRFEALFAGVGGQSPPPLHSINDPSTKTTRIIFLIFI